MRASLWLNPLIKHLMLLPVQFKHPHLVHTRKYRSNLEGVPWNSVLHSPSLGRKETSHPFIWYTFLWLWSKICSHVLMWSGSASYNPEWVTGLITSCWTFHRIYNMVNLTVICPEWGRINTRKVPQKGCRSCEYSVAMETTSQNMSPQGSQACTVYIYSPL